MKFFGGMALGLGTIDQILAIEITIWIQDFFLKNFLFTIQFPQTARNKT